MSDARETVEQIIDRLLDEMEFETKAEMERQMDYERMQFNWKRVNPIYGG
jgi:hypothetical protein